MHARDLVLATLTGRRTVHAYTRDPVPDAIIELSLAAAILAPNHRLTAPWRFVRGGRETRGRLAEIAVRLKGKPGAAPDAKTADGIRQKLLDPHELIVVSIVRAADPAVAREDYASAACAIQNLQLALWAHEVASKWSTGKLTQDPETHATLGIDAAQQEIIGFVHVGIADVVPPTPPRPALASLVRKLP